MRFALANQRSLPPRGLKCVAFSEASVATALEAGVEGGEGWGMGDGRVTFSMPSVPLAGI